MYELLFYRIRLFHVVWRKQPSACDVLTTADDTLRFKRDSNLCPPVAICCLSIYLSFQLVIWLIALVTSAPQLYEYSVYEEVEEEDDGTNYTKQECGSHDILENFEVIYAIIVVSVSYVIPGVILIINYTMIGR